MGKELRFLEKEQSGADKESMGNVDSEDLSADKRELRAQRCTKMYSLLL
jgi:hypothetical protein